MKSFRQLIVWQKSMDLVTDVYKITKGFPKEEVFGIVSQIQRSATSIPSNIAEGFGRKSDGDFGRFLSYSLGSNYELQTQIEIARNVAYINESDCESLILRLEEIARMIKGLKNKL